MPVRRVRGASRGSLPSVIERASQITAGRIRYILGFLDKVSDSGGGSPFGGGGTISKRDHLLLLARDPAYQSEIVAKMPMMNEDDLRQLKNDLARAASLTPVEQPPSNVPPTVTQLP